MLNIEEQDIKIKKGLICLILREKQIEKSGLPDIMEVSCVPTIKQAVISLVEKLPEDSTLEDIMEHLYVKQKILKGQQQLKSDQFYTHEQAKKIMKKWLK